MIKFSSMPNFRKLVESDTNIDDQITKLNSLKIFRSSRPDFLTANEVDRFKDMDFRCILDFRSAGEYTESSGSKLLDEYYPVYKVKYPGTLGYKPGQEVECSFVKTRNANPNLMEATYITNEQCTATCRKHVLINFFNIRYIWSVFNRAPFLLRMYSLLFLLFDVIFFTRYKYFVRFYAEHVLNKEGLVGQYYDMIDYSQAGIYSALKILTDKNNLPAMINCAHGKDRTGIVSALILACIGASPDYICRNYAESTNELSRVRKTLEDDIVTRLHLCPTFISSNYETMGKLLKYVETKYGTVGNYLESMGFTQKDQEQLKMNILS